MHSDFEDSTPTSADENGRPGNIEPMDADEHHIREAIAPLDSNPVMPPTMGEGANHTWFANPPAPNEHGHHSHGWTNGASSTTDSASLGHQALGHRLARVAVVALLAGGLGSAMTYGLLEGQGKTIGDRTVTVDRAPSIDGVTVDKALESIFTVAVRNGETGGGGSGVAIDKTRIVTNAHVVTLDRKIDSKDATVEVQDSTGQEFSATVVGVDETADVAVLEVEGAEFTPLKWSAGKPRVGEPVLAMGSPLGLADTVTDGIVSAVNRPVSLGGGADEAGMVTEAATFINAIQTDAAINSGNSGGALVSARGDLLGLNVAISSARGSTGNIGIGYAIPASYAKRVAEEIIANGVATHGVLGVSVTTDRSVGGSFENGARIEELTADSPAKAANLKINDVIVEVNGASITSAGGLTAAIKELAPGDEATIIVERGNATREFTVNVKGPE